MIVIVLTILHLVIPFGIYIYRKFFRKISYDWKVQTMLITGGAQGIGRNVVEICLKRGCKEIVIVDVKEPEFSLPKNVTFFKYDISLRANIQNLQTELSHKRLVPTIIVNNAGIWNGGKRIGELSDEQIERVINVNMMAPFWITRAFLPAMLKARHGRIVNVSSVLGLGGVAKMTDYCASKFGLFGMNESLRMELKADGHKDIICTVVCPFHVGTTLFENKVKWDHKWLMSTLTPHHVASKLVAGIEEGKEEVWLPGSMAIIPLLRSLPTTVYDSAHKFLGSDDSIITTK